MDVDARMWEVAPGRWRATGVISDLARIQIRASGATRERCLAALRRAALQAMSSGNVAAPRDLRLVVEVLPRLAGVAEAAEVMGWDKRRIITYMDRGRFPPPIQALASGRVWARSDLEEFARTWRARFEARRKGVTGDERGTGPHGGVPGPS